MKLSEHQIRMAEVVFENVKATGNGTPYYATISEWFKAAKVHGRGRGFLDTFKVPGTFKYELSWMLDTTLDAAVAKLNEGVPSSAPVRRAVSAPEVPVVEEEANDASPAPVVPKSISRRESMGCSEPIGFYIPSKSKTFVSFGPMKQLETIVASEAFLPTYIYGDTGIAKSMSVVQAAARNKRELFRVNVNINTDEEDFVGGFRLVDGETVFQKGPLVLAMERGALLLIDEISALSPSNAFCLFSVLEGNELYIKKTNERIRPAKGFNIIVTDNTKGKGSLTGRFVGTNVQNDALLDRFVVSLEYGYPSASQELRILNAVDNSNEELNRNLIKWANMVRKSFADGLVDENVSVRKLVSILDINRVFNDIKTSINLALNRFEENTKAAILDLFDKVVVDPTYGALDFNDPETSVTIVTDEDPVATVNF